MSARDDAVVLETIELTKIYRDFWGRESVKALDGLNIQIRRGEVFGLLGPNGSGKTTTVRLVLGLLFPTRGAVRLFGRDPGMIDVKKRVGYMPEESHLYEYLNAEEALDFFGRLFRLPRAERNNRCEALLDMVGLRRARWRPLGQYSKGMARRIGLAQALINDPDFLILDEPTTGLDPVGTREMKDLLLKLRHRGKTIFLCSHLLADVEEICDRICILYGGKQRAVGSVDELLTKRELTQIRAPHLEGAALQRVLAAVQQEAGGDGQVEVSSPTRRLEEYFLEVVEEARREKLRTDGAERGAGPAAFLGGPAETEGEQLLEELVQGAAEPHEEEEKAPAPQPVQALPGERDEALIEDLVRHGTAEQEQEETKEEPAAAMTPQTGVDENLLGELLAGAKPETEEDEQEAD